MLIFVSDTVAFDVDSQQFVDVQYCLADVLPAGHVQVAGEEDCASDSALLTVQVHEFPFGEGFLDFGDGLDELEKRESAVKLKI